MIAFLIWAFVGIVFIAMGIYAFVTKRDVTFGFWANARTFPVVDIKKYNRAVGKMWIVFGIIFILFGIPLLFCEQNSPLVLIPILGVMIEVIGVMVVYTIVIEKKYKKEHEI